MKNFLLFIFLGMTVSCLNAQTTGYLKVANHGALERVIHVSSGGYLTVGYDSVWKLQIVRWDNWFNPLWKCKLTDSRFSGGHSYITEANDGNFYFMGSSTENNGCTVIIKFSATGSVMWQRTYYVAGDFLSSFALSRASGNDNGFIFGGGQCALSNDIIKCDENGNIEWQQQYYYPLSTGVITCFSIIPDGNDYVIASGYNVNSLLTFKINSSGTLLAQSANTYTGMQIVPTRIIKLNSGGGYALLGNYNNSNNNKTEFVAIYNSSLQLLSFNEYTVTYDQFILSDITALNNGDNIFVNGSIYDNSVFYAASMYLSSSGSIIWKKLSAGNTGPGNKNVEFYGVAENNNRMVNVGSGYNEGCVFGVMDVSGNGLCNELAFDVTNVQRTLTLQTSSIFTVASTVLSAPVSYSYNSAVSHTKYVYCGNLGLAQDDEGTDRDIQLYPNPADVSFTVTDHSGSNYEWDVNVYDARMRLIFSSAFTGSLNIKTSEWMPGIYFVGFERDGLGFIRKIEILR